LEGGTPSNPGERTETTMFELDFSSNAEGLVAILLAIVVVAVVLI
jgi:hypothetical protein